MRAISLHQPFAAAVANGEKQWETRHWRLPASVEGQLVAIHAAKRWDRVNKEAARRLGLALHNDAGHYGHPEPANYRGGVVGLARIVRCEPMTRELIEAQTPEELLLGDWREGRYAWALRDVRALSEPYPLTGRQGFWRLTPEQEARVRLLAGLPKEPA